MVSSGVDGETQELNNDDIEVLELENALLRAHLARLGASAPQTQGAPRAEPQLKSTPSHPISEEQLVGICAAEAAALKKELLQLGLANEAQLSELVCRTTVAEQQAAAAQRDASDLERARNGGSLERNDNAVIGGEALLRFLNDRLITKDAAMAQCTLRSAALEAQLQKLERDSRKKTAMGENLQAVDLEKARIENKLLLQTSITSQHVAAKLKLSATASALALSDCVAELAKQTAETAATEGTIEELAAQLVRCQTVCLATKSQCAAEGKELQYLQKRASNAEDQPTVLEYVRLTAEVREVCKEHLAWERKLAGLRGSLSKASPVNPKGDLSGAPTGKQPSPAHEGAQHRGSKPELRRLQDRDVCHIHCVDPSPLPTVKGCSMALHKALSSIK